jgi:hypothetical protein
MNVWTGMRGNLAGASPLILAAHQEVDAAIPGIELGIAYYDGATVDPFHPTAFSHQINGARSALYALSRLGISGYDAMDTGPVLASAARVWAGYFDLTTTGHALLQNGTPLAGFQAWTSDWSAQIPVDYAMVTGAHTIRLVLHSPSAQPHFTYMRDCTLGGPSVYDTQNIFGIPAPGMPMVPCLGVQPPP